jgi:hypothetical protein
VRARRSLFGKLFRLIGRGIDNGVIRVGMLLGWGVISDAGWGVRH